MVRSIRCSRLKIPEMLGAKSGRNIDGRSKWRLFFAIEVESLKRLTVPPGLRPPDAEHAP